MTGIGAEAQGGLSLKQNIMWNSLGNLVYLFAQWVLTVVVVRVAGFETAGDYSLALTLSNVFVCVALFGIRSFQVSDVSGKYADSSYISARLMTCLASLVFCVVFTALNGYSLSRSLVIVIYMVFRLSEALLDVYHGINQMRARMDIIGKSCLMRAAGTLAAFTVILVLTKSLFFAVLGMAAAAYLVVLFYDIPSTKRLSGVPTRYGLSGVKQLLKECFPLLLVQLMTVMIASAPRYFLEGFRGSHEMGVYVSIATPAVIVQVAASFFFNPFTTSFALAFTGKDRKRFSGLFGICAAVIAALGLVSVLAAYLFGDWGLALLFGQDILAYSYLLIPVIVVTVLTAAVWLLCALLTVFRDFWGLVISNGAAVLLSLLLSVWLIPGYGMRGVNWALIVSLTVEIVLLSLFFVKGYIRGFGKNNHKDDVCIS